MFFSADHIYQGWTPLYGSVIFHLRHTKDHRIPDKMVFRDPEPLDQLGADGESHHDHPFPDRSDPAGMCHQLKGGKSDVGVLHRTGRIFRRTG